ncbi:MAG: phosphate/phosphite/phosphonate ABC transporter substrate-binding protein [Anaerolineales bacterium]
MDPMVAGLAEWLAAATDWRVEFVRDISWQERELAFDRGEIQLLWLCGLPYVRKADDLTKAVWPVAAPVMASDRYRNRPIYFSDVVVRHDSEFESWFDLAGARWAINEPGSHSGYNVTRWRLAQEGLDWSFFEQVLVAGSHESALSLLLEEKIDAAAIDSTVLALAARSNPNLMRQVRVIDTLGPSPAPPWVCVGDVDPDQFQKLKSALLAMGQSTRGRDILALAGFVRMAAVADEDYEPIRRMDQLAQKVPEPDWLDP